jgi:catechol 2,3-dioxygenase-like lactoylglutathione lyase family enzyme
VPRGLRPVALVDRRIRRQTARFEKTAWRFVLTVGAMNEHLSHIGLWVRHQDEAAAFFTDKLGFEVREDVTLAEMGGYRWLTVGPPERPDFALALNVPGPPFPAEQVEPLKKLMADGLLGGIFFSTDDCRATYEQLKTRGAEIEQEPTQQPYGIEIVLRDPSGNSIRYVQRT